MKVTKFRKPAPKREYGQRTVLDLTVDVAVVCVIAIVGFLIVHQV